MEKLILKIKGLGLWEVINHNPETKYVQLEGVEKSKQKVKLWIPEAMALTIASMDELRKKRDSMRKTADYFRNERDTYKAIANNLSKEVEAIKEKNIKLEESVAILSHMAEDANEEIQMRFHKNKVVTTILVFVSIMEAILFLVFYLIMQK
jgi:uncharacterized coiled-coil DUF342 family protein